MSSMNFSTSKQYVKPPQRGVFPLDHDDECKPFIKKYLSCLNDSNDIHHKCKELSKDYLQCRMDRQLMSKENLNDMGYAKDKAVVGAHEYDKAKEKAGFIAGKHIHKKSKWWFQSSPAKQNNWDVGSDKNGDDNKTTTTTTNNNDIEE